MVDKTYIFGPSNDTLMRTARLTKKEDKFWEEIYLQLVKWGIHDDLTYDLCFVLVKAKFERLMKIDRLI